MAEAELKSILDVILRCEKCGADSKIRDAVPCAGGGTGFGCPVPDCGGMLSEISQDGL